MGTNFWWLYDIAFVAVALLSIFSCAKKGFSKIIILIIGCVVSLLLASYLSEKAAPFIYDSFIKKTTIEAIKETFEDYSPATSVKEAIEGQDYGAIVDEGKVGKILQAEDPVEMLYEYTNQAAGDVVDTHESYKKTLTVEFSKLLGKQLGTKLPPYVVRETTARLTDNDELFVETVNILLKKPNDLPEYIEENYVRKPALKLVRAFAFIICYFICMILIRIVVYKTFNLGLLNGYDKLDHIVGGLFGVIQAAALLIMTAVAVKILIQIAESDGSFLSYETVDQTRIFSRVFNYIERY